MQAVQEGGPAPSRPADGAIRSMRLAALNFLRTRPDLAERPLRVALAGWTGVADEDLVDVAEALVALAGAAWTCDAYPLIQQLSERIRPLAARADDAHLDLLSAMVGHIGEIPAVPLEQSKAAAAAIFQQAEAIGNLFAQYMAALLACGVATIEQDPVAGLLWTKRVVPVYLLLGHEGGSVFLEALGNFAAMQGNYMEAVRLYTGAKQLARAAGSLWPNRPQTPALEEQTRAALAPDALATAVSAGRALTLADVVAEWASADKESPLTA